MGEAVGDVCRGGGYYEDDSDGDTGSCLSVCRLHGDDGEFPVVVSWGGHAEPNDDGDSTPR